MKNLFRRGPRLCTPVLALACGVAAAQSGPKPQQLDPVVVTATRTPIPLRDVLSDVTVLTRDDLDRKAGGLADVLRGVPGFEMSRNGGPAGTTSMFVRGGESRFTAVLVDGVRVDSQATGGASWEAIPLSQIDRIEIIRGPASSVYGSDAISGVVQIFTRKAEPGLHLDIGAGIGNVAKGDASVSGTLGRFDLTATTATERGEGFNSQVGNNPDIDGYQSHSTSGRLGWNFIDGQRLEVSALTSHITGQYDAFASTVNDYSERQLDAVSALWSAQWTKAWNSQLSFGQSDDHYETRPSPYSTDTRIRTATLLNELRLGAHNLSLVLERREDALDNASLLGSPHREQDQDAVALGYGWRAGSFAVQLNGRHDDNSDYGSTDTGSLALGLDVAEGWRVTSSIGNGFRAPTLYQRFTEYGPTTTELKPERSRSNIELGLRHQAGRFESSVTAYRNRITDLIVFGATGPCPSAFGCYENVGNAELKGVTFASTYRASDLRVSGSYDLQEPKNKDTGKLLPRRSRQHASLSVDKDFDDKTSAGVQWLVSGKRYDNAANTLELGGYSVVNVNLQHRMTQDWQLVTTVENIFDKNYQTARTYNSTPLTVFMGARWTPSF
jgi:vitamin B12 transporter